MTMSGVTALQRSGLNDFLFADVGTEANGMMLSVASIFARQGNDPWREAGRLAGMPRRDATKSLAGTIAGMPDSLWPLADAAPIAARLVALLPTRSIAATAKAAPLSAISGLLPRRATILVVGVALAAGYVVSLLM